MKYRLIFWIIFLMFSIFVSSCYIARRMKFAIAFEGIEKHKKIIDNCWSQADKDQFIERLKDSLPPKVILYYCGYEFIPIKQKNCLGVYDFFYECGKNKEFDHLQKAQFPVLKFENKVVFYYGNPSTSQVLDTTVSSLKIKGAEKEMEEFEDLYKTIFSKEDLDTIRCHFLGGSKHFGQFYGNIKKPLSLSPTQFLNHS